MRTVVYVDGFNLYYRALRGTPHRWLDLARLCALLLPRHQIADIKYFTAHVRARPNDPDQPTRQQTYLRALRTIPNLQIILGHYLENEVRLPIAGVHPVRFARVMRSEEKGSDVNIATHLIHDAHSGRFQAAVLVTNDSDLAEPIRIVKNELNLRIGLLCPGKRPTRALIPHLTFFKHIREPVLAQSQFPGVLSDAQGVFSKPPSW